MLQDPSKERYFESTQLVGPVSQKSSPGIEIDLPKLLAMDLKGQDPDAETSTFSNDKITTCRSNKI